MKRIRVYRIPVALLLTLLFSFYAVGCHLYSWRALPKEKIINLTGKPLNIFLVDASQPTNLAWAVKAKSMDQHWIIGTTHLLSPAEIRNIYTVSGEKSKQLSQYHIILNLKKGYAQTLLQTPTDSIAMDQVEKMMVYQYDSARSDVATAFTVIGVALLVIGVIGLIALASKSQSCPFVYADNPDGRVFEGELYSGATYPQLERHDWLPMPHLKPTGDTYRLVVANKVREIQHTNMLELIAIDHPNHTTVLFDKYGRLHTLANPQAPVAATALDGQDVRDQIIREDSLRFFGTPDNKTPEAAEGLILQFQRPPGVQQAKLVVNAKNSMWLDHAHGLMMDEFGRRAGEIREANLEKSAGDLQEWMLQQNIPLSVWLETTPGRWERVDHYNLAGPMALKRDVLPLDLSKVKGDQIRLKLGFGFLFWEIDYVGMDFTADQQTTVHALAPTSAISQDGTDLTSALRTDDATYYDQPNIGDEAVVVFPAPPLQSGQQRSLILHAKGHYQILREPKPDAPSLRHLKEFKKPNAFPVYARNQWHNLTGNPAPAFTSNR